MGDKSSLRLAPSAFLPFMGGAWLTVQVPLVFLVVSSSAAAQPADANCPTAPSVRELRVGNCFRSSIGADDPKTQDNTSYEDWRLDLEAGETVQIDMDAIPTHRQSAPGQPSAPLEFDTYLELRRDGVAEPLATNDDREGSRNSRIRFTAPATDHYIVRARPLYLDEGDYRLSVSRPPAPPAAIPITAGRTRLERVTAGTPSELGGGQTRLFSFDGTAGEVVRLALDAGVFNFTMELTDGADRVLGAAGTFVNREVVAILQRTGTYRLRLLTENAATTLIFQRRPPGDTPAPRRVEIGETVEGEIGFESQVGPDPYGSGGRSFYGLYEFNLQAGELVTVTLASGSFDSVLDAGVMSPLGFASALTNDDFEEGSRNSRLVVRPDRTGPILLRVRALGTGLGAYRLIITRGIEYPDAGIQE